MKFFLDTANLDEIQQAFELGIMDGVTTNPALLSKQSGSYKEGVQNIVSLTGGAIVFAEVLATQPAEMIREAKEISSWGPQMIVKLPMTPAGIQACAALSKDGINCAITLVYSEPQAIVAAKAGAKYIAPFIARANEVGMDGTKTISKIAQSYNSHNIPTEILAASVRNGYDAAKALRCGATSVTLPYGVLMGMMKNPVTDMTLNSFLDLWSNKNAGGVF
ncbi:fructose-6-phosphate aldolase [Dysosmobacter sp. Marseille-Q4140]|nr:fructose-6-phosphate aldolase [Dysosmobacter sp. Marseille-Q4140]